MGRDNHPKNRQKKELKRKEANRASYDRILIVSEGKKTEPNYFKEIRKTYNLHGTNVVISPSDSGTLPMQVVNYAKELFEDGDSHKKISPRAFERVYVVFDRDDHKRYHDALKKAEALNGNLKNNEKKNITFKAIASVPSFELWLLLHYEDIQAPLHRDKVMSRLKKYIPDYEKGKEGIFKATSENLTIAIQRAENLAKHFRADTDPEPYTGVVDLVKLLINLRNSKADRKS